MWRRHHHGMLIGIVDVGSNTVRLLLTHCGRRVLTRREMLRLGVDVERSGRFSAETLEHAAVVVAGYAEEARAAGGEHLEVLITSPGRQAANGEELRRPPRVRRRLPGADTERGRGGQPRVRRGGRPRLAATATGGRRRRRRRRICTDRHRHPP